jgi:MYXO-CTERM domain-containing protein
MTKSSKILATVGVIFGFMILSAALQAGSGPGGRSPGILGLILLFGLFAGIRAIWKRPKDDDADRTSLKKD